MDYTDEHKEDQPLENVAFTEEKQPAAAGGRFDREDMAESEIETFDKFMDFEAQVVGKYGKFFM